MALIFGRFANMSDELREAVLELSLNSLSISGDMEAVRNRIHDGAECLYRAAANKEPHAHFSTLVTAARELALEASELGLLDKQASARASDRMKMFGAAYNPSPSTGSKRKITYLGEGVVYIDRRRNSVISSWM